MHHLFSSLIGELHWTGTRKKSLKLQCLTTIWNYTSFSQSVQHLLTIYMYQTIFFVNRCSYINIQYTLRASLYWFRINSSIISRNLAIFFSLLHVHVLTREFLWYNNLGDKVHKINVFFLENPKQNYENKAKKSKIIVSLLKVYLKLVNLNKIECFPMLNYRNINCLHFCPVLDDASH